MYLGSGKSRIWLHQMILELENMYSYGYMRWLMTRGKIDEDYLKKEDERLKKYLESLKEDTIRRGRRNLGRQGIQILEAMK